MAYRKVLEYISYWGDTKNCSGEYALCVFCAQGGCTEGDHGYAIACMEAAKYAAEVLQQFQL